MYYTIWVGRIIRAQPKCKWSNTWGMEASVPMPCSSISWISSLSWRQHWLFCAKTYAGHDEHRPEDSPGLSCTRWPCQSSWWKPLHPLSVDQHEVGSHSDPSTSASMGWQSWSRALCCEILNTINHKTLLEEPTSDLVIDVLEVVALQVDDHSPFHILKIIGQAGNEVPDKK